MLRIFIILAVGLMALGGAAHAQLTEARPTRSVALLIGNSAYQQGSTLSGAEGDVAEMAEALKALGFEVTVRRDLDLDALGGAVRQFGAQAREADTALFFFAGHGAEIAGRNYLFPIDAALSRPGAERSEALPLDVVLEEIGEASRLSIAIIDACRDGAPGLGGAGSACFRPVQARARQIVAFSSSPGQTASDARSPFIRQLATLLRSTPESDVRRIFMAASADTQRAAGGGQRPYVAFGDLPSEEVSLGGNPGVIANRGAGETAVAALSDPAEEDDRIALRREGEELERQRRRFERLLQERRELQQLQANQSPRQAEDLARRLEEAIAAAQADIARREAEIARRMDELRGAVVAVAGLEGGPPGQVLAARQKNYARQSGPAVQAADAARFALQSLPPLPAPLPAASDKTACPKPEAPSLESYQAAIDAALISAGHRSSSYFRFQDGFAVVSRLERIRDDGAPAKSERWPDASLHRHRSLVDFIAGFIAPRPGYYRFAVIAVGASEPAIDVARRQTPEGGARLLARGAAEKPDLTGAAIDPTLKCTILIYEFEQEPRGEKTRQRFPSLIPAIAHARYLGFRM